MFAIWPSARAPSTYAEAAAFGDAGFSQALHLALRAQGLLVMPSQYGRIYLSFEHNDAVVEQMTRAFEAAAVQLAPRFAGRN